MVIRRGKVAPYRKDRYYDDKWDDRTMCEVNGQKCCYEIINDEMYVILPGGKKVLKDLLIKSGIRFTPPKKLKRNPI